MQREEKQMDMFLENSLIKLNDLKKAIAQMIRKIGNFDLICLHFLNPKNLCRLQSSSMRASIGQHSWIILR